MENENVAESCEIFDEFGDCVFSDANDSISDSESDMELDADIEEPNAPLGQPLPEGSYKVTNIQKLCNDVTEQQLHVHFSASGTWEISLALKPMSKQFCHRQSTPFGRQCHSLSLRRPNLPQRRKTSLLGIRQTIQKSRF